MLTSTDNNTLNSYETSLLVLIQNSCQENIIMSIALTPTILMIFGCVASNSNLTLFTYSLNYFDWLNRD